MDGSSLESVWFRLLEGHTREALWRLFILPWMTWNVWCSLKRTHDLSYSTLPWLSTSEPVVGFLQRSHDVRGEPIPQQMWQFLLLQDSVQGLSWGPKAKYSSMTVPLTSFMVTYESLNGMIWVWTRHTRGPGVTFSIYAEIFKCATQEKNSPLMQHRWERLWRVEWMRAGLNQVSLLPTTGLSWCVKSWELNY